MNGQGAHRVVGVLGGMGPEVTVLLMSRVIALAPARDDADHVPLLVDHNPQVPSRIAALIEGGGADPAPVLAGMTRRLTRWAQRRWRCPATPPTLMRMPSGRRPTDPTSTWWR